MQPGGASGVPGRSTAQPRCSTWEMSRSEATPPPQTNSRAAAPHRCAVLAHAQRSVLPPPARSEPTPAPQTNSRAAAPHSSVLPLSISRMPERRDLAAASEQSRQLSIGSRGRKPTSPAGAYTWWERSDLDSATGHAPLPFCSTPALPSSILHNNSKK